MNQIINDLLTVVNNIGSAFCNHALSMFAQSGMLIVLLLIIDFMLSKKVRAVFRYCLWMLVFVKLILPPGFSLPTGIGYWCSDSLYPKKIVSKPITDNTSNAESIMPDMSEGSAINSEPAQARPFQTTPATIAPVGSVVTGLHNISRQAIVFLIWLVGVLVFSVLLIQRMFFVFGLIAQSEPAQPGLLEMLNHSRQQVGIARNINLKLSHNIQSPAVCGFFKPVILMPTSLLEKLPAGKLRAVLIHELVHIKRYDLWVNFAQTFLQIIYFYNPFVWLANAVVRRLREQAVDETVLVTLGAEAKSYSNTLIDIAETAFFKTNFGLRLIGVAESKKSLHRRIRHMLSRPIPKSAKIGVLGVLTIITLAAVLLPMAAAAKDNPKEQPQFTARLSDQVSVELVGVCDWPEKGKRCWRPDGSKLTPEIYASKWNVRPKIGDYGFMFKVSGPHDLNFSCNKIDGTTSMEGSCQVVDAKGNELERFETVISDMKEGQSSTTIRLGIAAGPWTTISTHDGSGIKAGKKGVVLWSHAFETNDGTHITTSVEWRKDRAERVVAIYKKDKLYTTEHDAIATGKVHQITATFKNLKLNQIREFQYQVRPYDWATFENVSVKPGVKTDVQIGFEPADKKAVPAKEDLQSLIDCAKAGDTVIVPKGIYKEPIDINKSLTLKGESRAECVFEITADRPAIFIDTKSKGEVVVEDLTIKWQLATSNKGIERPFALGVKDTQAEIKNCSFVPLGNSQRSPVAVRADGFSNLNISRSRFEGFEYVICYGQGTKGKTTDCLIMDCGHQGIINYTGATLHVERNVITGSKFHAVRCTGGTLHVKDNLLINNANRGIYLGNRSGSGTITNNLIINNAVGIGAFASAKYEISNNVIADSSYSGIGMYKSCYLTIRDNIFLNNERGWVMFDKGEKGGNTSYRNTFRKNKVDDENFSKTANSINADPGFMDPENGDFSLKPGPAKENKQGLTNPQLFKDLWKIWKNREDKNVPFTK
jgi:beta-lactamase regulating signal transducer with metallopeptidase domain/nitrous oxidase accessory protein NosD